jgi:hypothetical protein
MRRRIDGTALAVDPVMRRLLLPLLLTVLGSTTAFADPTFNPRVRYIHDETLAHGSTEEVSAPRASATSIVAPQPSTRSADLTVATSVARRTFQTPVSSLTAPSITPKLDSMVILRRAVVDQLTAVDTPNVKVQTLPQIIKSADGGLLGMGLKVRF